MLHNNDMLEECNKMKGDEEFQENLNIILNNNMYRILVPSVLGKIKHGGRKANPDPAESTGFFFLSLIFFFSISI